MTPNEIIEVVQAFIDGKVIQHRLKRGGHWVDSTPLWDFVNFDYRARPTPGEWFIYKYPDNQIGTYSAPSAKMIKVREVLEDQ